MLTDIAMVDRYPIVERALSDNSALSNPEFAASIRRHVRGMLQENRGAVAGPTKRTSFIDLL